VINNLSNQILVSVLTSTVFELCEWTDRYTHHNIYSMISRVNNTCELFTVKCDVVSMSLSVSIMSVSTYVTEHSPGPSVGLSFSLSSPLL